MCDNIFKYGRLFCLLMFVPAAGIACSPDMAVVNSPYEMKISRPLFIGEVVEAGEDYVAFKVITSGKNWKRPANRLLPTGDTEEDRVSPDAGQTFRLKRQSYGSCGELKFKKGETWLYTGNDLPFGASIKLVPSDLGDDNGKDIGAVIQRIAKKIGLPPLEPMPKKETLFMPGNFNWTSPDASDNRSYELTVSAIDPKTSLHSLKINILQGNSQCAAEGSAPPYGFGEIVFTVPPAASPLEKCSIVLEQHGDKVTVRQNSKKLRACEDYFKCDKPIFFDSPADLIRLTQ